MMNNISFNQSHSCVSVSTDGGHKIFNCYPFGEFYRSQALRSRLSISEQHGGKPEKAEQPTAFLKMLFSTSLTVIVPKSLDGSGNRLLKVYNLKQNLKICELTFPSTIIDIRLNRRRLVVILDVGQIFIYDLSSVKLLKILDVASLGKKFVGDLGAGDGSYLVLPVSILNDQAGLFNSEKTDNKSGKDTNEASSPSSNQLDSLIDFTAENAEEEKSSHNRSNSLRKKTNISLADLKHDGDGWVLVYDAINLRPVLIYKAHDSAIAKMSISNDNTLVATASTRGTLIRVFHLVLGEKSAISRVTTLRRGHQLAKIGALCFNHDNSILGCASESETIHLFKINLPENDENMDNLSNANVNNANDSDEERLSDDLNESLANLLLWKNQEPEERGYFNFNLKQKVIDNYYSKSLMKKLPYKKYLENLALLPPERSFAYIKVPEDSHPNRFEIGFTGNYVLVASYQTGEFYHYKIPKETDKREECELVSRYSLE